MGVGLGSVVDDLEGGDGRLRQRLLVVGVRDHLAVGVADRFDVVATDADATGLRLAAGLVGLLLDLGDRGLRDPLLRD